MSKTPDKDSTVLLPPVPRGAKRTLDGGKRIKAETMARLGHVAMFLRMQMRERRWTIPDLAKQIGLQQDNTAPYGWINATGAPGATSRQKLGRLFGKPPEFFNINQGAQARDLLAGSVPAFDETETKTKTKTSTSGLPALAPALEHSPAPAPAPTPRDVLLFSINEHGQARIRLDTTLPLEHASTLLRLLLDMGVAPPPPPNPAPPTPAPPLGAISGPEPSPALGSDTTEGEPTDC